MSWYSEPAWYVHVAGLASHPPVLDLYADMYLLGPGPVSANSTIPFASGTIGLTHPTANATTGQPSEAPPTYNNGASGLGGFGAAAFSVVAVLMGAFA